MRKETGAGSSRKSYEPALRPSLMSTSKQEGDERCASCGKPATTQFVTELDNVPLCEGCSDRLLAGEAVTYFPPTEEEPSPPPEKRFADLFKAARVLLRDGKAEED